MNKKYLMRGFAALALIAGFSSCVKDVDGMSAEEEAAKGKENAELQLGITIPDNQTWDMASQVSATVTVNGDYGANYIVNIYENNPFVDHTAVVLGRASVVSGGTAEFDFTCPNGVRSVFAAIKDEKGYSYVKPVAVVDGKIETTFGGEAAAGARSMRAARRGSAADDFVVPTYSQPDFSAYIDNADEITAENNTATTSVRHYVIPAGTTWNDNIPLISASDPNDQSIVSVYVLGTLNVNAEQKINGGYGGAYKLIVGNGGVVNIASGVKLLSNANQDSGYVGEIHVLAGGTITGEGTLEFSNGTNAYNYNAGTIDVATLNNNGGVLYNVGSIEADVLQGGAGNSTIINQKKVTIGKAVYGNTSSNLRIMNNCWWEVTGAFACRNIVQGEGAYFHAAELAMSGSEDGQSTLPNSCIYAKDNSLIDITGAVAFNGVDIIGPTGDNYAYLQFGSVGLSYCDTNYADSWDGGHHISVGAIQNNIRLSVDSANDNYNKYNNRNNPYQALLDLLNGEMACTYNYDVATNGEWADTQKWPVQGNGNAVLVDKGQYTAATVEESDCSPGVVIVPPTPIIEEPKIYTYAFEDQLFAGDYDMNDVVLKVSYHADRNAKGVITAVDSTKLDVKMVAAGATFKIKVLIGGTATSQTAPDGSVMRTVDLVGAEYLFDGKEIHEALGVNAGVMVNTGNGKAQDGVAPVLDTVSVPSDWDGDFTHLRFSIEVLSTGHTLTYPNDDVYPYALMIPTDWAWPLERISIVQAYWYHNGTDITESFAWWAQTSPHPASAELWYNHPVTGKVMTNE